MDDVLISFGDAVKATKDGLVAGYLVRFGSPRDTDLEGDYFGKATDFGRPLSEGDTFALNLYYNHGHDRQIGRKSIGSGVVTVREDGLWYEAQVAESEEYRAEIMRLASEGRLGFSSGAAGHLVTRSASGVGKSHRIESWPLGEASLTPRPAESRNVATVKSLSALFGDGEAQDAVVDDPSGSKTARPTTITDFERRLRDALSLSRKEATLIASKAWPLLSDSEMDARDDADDADGREAKSSTDDTHRANLDLIRRALTQKAQAQAASAA